MFCQSWISVANQSSFSDDSREIWKHLPISLIYLSPHCLVVRSPSQLNEDIFRKLLKVGNLSIISWSVLKIRVFIYRVVITPPFPFTTELWGIPIHFWAQPEILDFPQDPEIDTSILFEDKNATVILWVYRIPCSTTWNIEVPHVLPLQTILIYIAHKEMPQTDKFHHTGTVWNLHM